MHFWKAALYGTLWGLGIVGIAAPEELTARFFLSAVVLAIVVGWTYLRLYKVK